MAHGLRRDEQPLGDGDVAVALGQQVENVPLPVGQFRKGGCEPACAGPKEVRIRWAIPGPKTASQPQDPHGLDPGALSRAGMWMSGPTVGVDQAVSTTTLHGSGLSSSRSTASNTDWRQRGW